MKRKEMKESTVQLLGTLFFFWMGIMMIIAAYLDIPIHSYYPLVNATFEKLGTPVVATFCAVFNFVLAGIVFKRYLDERKKEQSEASVSDT